MTALALVVAVGATGCSSDSNKKVASKTTLAPEQRRTSDAAVAAGLRKIEAIAAGIAKAAGSDKSRAMQLADEIEPVWQTIEGTVKAKDENAYLAFEDAFALLEGAAKSGDAGKARKGADDVTAAVKAYLAESGPASTVAAGPTTIETYDFRFDPTSLTIKAGQTVHLSVHNEGQAEHNFSLKEAKVNVDVPAGTDKDLTFTAPATAGTYTFFCEYHQSRGMKGTIQVTAPGN